MEIWKDIVELEGLYQISNFGRIKSLSRRIPSVVQKCGYRIIKERILKSKVDGGGYLFNILSGKVLKLHRTVANYFIPNPENKPEVNHKDKNKDNNHIDNLEWVTSKENTIHTFLTGHPADRIKLKFENIENIKKMSVSGMNNNEIAKIFNVKRKTIWRVVTERSWKF